MVVPVALEELGRRHQCGRHLTKVVPETVLVLLHRQRRGALLGFGCAELVAVLHKERAEGDGAGDYECCVWFYLSC